MRWIRTLICVASFVVLLPSCIEALFGSRVTYDTRRVVLQFFSFCNQRLNLKNASNKSWQGDWILRRERLNLIDRELRTTKPDLLVLQEVMSKEDNPYDSDQAILNAGSLAGYEWQKVDVQRYEDTHEKESMVVATGLPLRSVANAEESGLQWRLGKNGLLSAFAVELEGQPLVVFNVYLPESEAQQGKWYTFIQERMSEQIIKAHSCEQRLVLAGYIEGDNEQAQFANLQEAFKLVDTSVGFCEKEADCHTASPANDLYKAIFDDPKSQRLDRIFVHQSALVFSSTRDFSENPAPNEYASSFGLKQLWAAPRFGWVAGLRFARCEEPSL